MTEQSPVKDVPPSPGLTSDEARRRLEKFGPNTIPDTTLHPLRRALSKFWAPVPWVLEAAVVLELALGKYVEASIIAGLLAFNAVLGLLQEGRAGACAGGSGQRLAAGARAAFGRGGARRVRNSFVFSFPYSRWPAAREKRLGRSAQSAE